MNAPAPLPKAGSSALRELWEQVKRVLDVPRSIVVIEGALDRKALEDILSKLSKGSLGRPGQIPRPELVGRIADAFLKNVDAAFGIMRELDKSCHKERHIVASIDEASLEERLASYRAMDFRRERARLVWALIRDGRDAHRTAADRILTEAFKQGNEHEMQREALEKNQLQPEVAQELKKRLDTYQQAIEEQQRQLAKEAGAKEHAERERSELLVRLGQRERALRDEEELRRRADDENKRLTAEINKLRAKLEERDPSRITNVEAELERLRDKVRSLEDRAARGERVTALEEQLAQIEKAHDGERRQWARTREELEEQIATLLDKEKAALERAAALREELHAARRQLAGEKDGPAPVASGRVGVFVDAANLSASARRDFGSKLDYRALLDHVLDGRQRARAVCFVVKDGQENVHAGFVKSLRDAGFEVREKRPKARSDGSNKADWDMGIAMEILDSLETLDVVLLCSGDGDFLPLVQRVRRDGKRVEVAAFRASTDDALIAGIDAFWPLDGRFRMMT